MKKGYKLSQLWLGLFISIAMIGSMQATSIHDIQYTTDAGSGSDCYPSSEDGNSVEVTGLVTAVMDNGRFYIQDGPNAWDGIYVYDSSVMPSVGDDLTITAEVDEYYGLSELKNVSAFTVNSSGNELNAPIVVTTGDLAGGCAENGESFEGLFVKIDNVTVTAAADQHGQWFIDDGSGACEVEDAFFEYAPEVGAEFSSVLGVVSYGYGEYEVNPRGENDIQLANPPLVIPDLMINEFLAASDACCDDGFGEAEDFIEIYNTGSEAVDLGGLWITDDLGDPTSWEQIPNTDASITTVDPGGFIVIWADKDQDTQGILHTNDIKLSSGGEEIGIIAISGADTAFVDSLTFGEQTDDVSFGRYPDGTENWAFLSTPTPGSANEMEQSSVTTIHDIQYVTDPSTDDASPLVDQEVTISGIVTAEFWNGSDNRYLFVQDAPGPWNGIVCFNYDGWDTFTFQSPMGDVNSIAEGDSVTLTGVVTEYYGLTELVDISSAMIHGPAIAPFGPDQVTAAQVGTGGPDAEAFESCLVAVDGVTITEPDEGNGEWTISDGTGSVRVDDKWDYFFWPEADVNLAKVVGVLDYNYSNTKIQPRLARDVVEAVGEPARIQRIQQVLFSDLLKTGEDEVSDISYYEGETVTLKGIVTMPTGLSYAGSGVKFIYEDVHGGPWSAILSYDPDSTAFPILFEGDLVHATGYIAEYSTGPANMTELFITEPVDLVDFEQEMPPIDTVSTGDLRWPTEAEQWGNVMVKVVDGIVSGNEYQYELFSVNDGSGDVLVDDDSDSIGVFFDNNPVPPVGSFVQSLRGWVYHHYGSNADSSAYKLEPLYIGDLEFGAGPPAINEPTREPCAPTSTDGSVTVTCEIEDNSTVASAEIFYSSNGGAYQSVAMTPGDGFEWSGDIPISDGDDVNYYIVATDDGADQSEPKSSTFPYDNENGQLGFVVTDNLTIYDVQFTSWPSGVSRYHNCDVTIKGIVTGDTAQYNSGYSSYAFQDGSGPWLGVLFDGDALDILSLGDEVQVSGFVTDFDPEWHFKFDGNTRVVNSTVEVLSTGNAVPAPALVSCEELSQTGEEVESYEGTLVQLNNVTVSSVNSYDWAITDDSGFECLIDDDMASIGADNFMSTLTEGQVLESIRGIFNFSFGTYKVQVRNMADLGQSAGINDDVNLNPYSYALYENFPNPFNPETQIRFELAATQDVKLAIYDILGRRVRFLTNQSYGPGFHVVNWNGRNDMGERVASGVYVYRIKAGNFISHRKMLMVQ